MYLHANNIHLHIVPVPHIEVTDTELLCFCCFFRDVFKVDDIALNYRDLDGDLIRIHDDEDVQLMIQESRNQQGKFQRPVNQFPWELFITLSPDLSAYNTEA